MIEISEGKLSAAKGKIRKILSDWATANSTISLEDALLEMWKQEELLRLNTVVPVKKDESAQ